MKKFVVACCLIVALAWATGAMAQDANYTVKPGDLLSISVWKEPDLQKPALVRPDGSFSFPLVGEIDAKGPWNEGDSWQVVDAPAFQAARGMNGSNEIESEASAATDPDARTAR